jgi:hypothetical protein
MGRVCRRMREIQKKMHADWTIEDQISTRETGSEVRALDLKRVGRQQAGRHEAEVWSAVEWCGTGGDRGGENVPDCPFYVGDGLWME